MSWVPGPLGQVMTRMPCIVCCAITGSLPQEVRQSGGADHGRGADRVGARAFEAGASIVHAHVRNEDGTPTSDAGPLRQAARGTADALPRPHRAVLHRRPLGVRAREGRHAGLRPDMASLAVGSNNFPTRVYENSPDLVDWLASEMLVNEVKPEIEAFDLSHIFQAVSMSGTGRIAGPLYVQFVMGVKNAMPVDRPAFDFFVETLKRLAPDAEWCGAGIGRHQITLNEWCVSSGGHARTGLEDNVRLDRDTLAPSNAALVRRVVDLCDKHGRPVATAEQARAILGLPATAAAG